MYKGNAEMAFWATVYMLYNYILRILDTYIMIDECRMCVGGWCAESYRAKSRSDERIALAWVGVNCTVRREKVLREYHQHRGGSNCTERREKHRENIISIGEDRIVPSEEKSIERIASASGRIELYRAKRKASREYHQHRGGSNCTERREKHRENSISIGED